MEPIGMSDRLASLVRRTPGAQSAYLNNAYAKVWIDQLDVHWQAVVDAVTGDDGAAEAVADRYVQTMLAHYVAASIGDDARRTEAIRALERSTVTWGTLKGTEIH